MPSSRSLGAQCRDILWVVSATCRHQGGFWDWMSRYFWAYKRAKAQGEWDSFGLLHASAFTRRAFFFCLKSPNTALKRLLAHSMHLLIDRLMIMSSSWKEGGKESLSPRKWRRLQTTWHGNGCPWILVHGGHRKGPQSLCRWVQMAENL